MVVCGLFANPLLAQDVFVGQPVRPDQAVSFDAINHQLWHQLLQQYVDQDGRVDYRGWSDNAAAVSTLNEYLNQLSHADPNTPASRHGQLAFWINAYNAVTVHGILREYPTDSIRNHTAKLVGYNIWKNLKLHVGQEAYSLDAIEHQVLRPMGEPRIHFAIVCASHSCPRLLNEAYTGERLEAQLTANTQQFFASPVGFRYDPAARRFYVSKILDWFADDFGSNQATRLRTIAPYLPTDAAREAALANSVKVTYLPYDWSLNDQAIRR